MTKIQELRQLAHTIKTETKVGGNTADRVGSAFEGVADALEGTEQIAEMDKAVQEVQQQVEASKAQIQSLVNALPVVQQTGDSTTSVMSQKAVTKNIMIYDAGTLTQITNGTDDDYKLAAINSVPSSLKKGGLTVLYTPYGGTEKISIFLNSSSWSSSASDWQQSGKTTANKVLKQYSNIDLTDGYYNNDGTSITNTTQWSCIKFNVSEYVGKILSTSNSIDRNHSGWVDSDGTITRISLDSNRQTIIPTSAVTVFISILTNRLFVTIDIIENITLSEVLDNKADLDSVLLSYQEIKTKSTDVKNGYLNTSGNVVGTKGYYIKVDCSSYIGDKAIFQPAWGDSTLTGFILDDGTIRSLSASKTDKFSSIVPANAKYAVESYIDNSDESKRHITFLHKISVGDLMTQETADKRYINIETLKSELKTTESDLIIGYTNSSGNTITKSGYHSLKIDVSKYQGATCAINKPYVSGSVSTTGYENISGTKKQIKVVTGVVNNIVIPDDAVTLWVTFMDSVTPIEEQYITITKYDNDVASKSYVDSSVSSALKSAKDYTNEILFDIGIHKLPPTTLWYVMGDSITARGLTVGVGNKYYEFIASRNNLTYGKEVVSIANDGATITYRSSGYGGSQLSKISSIPTNATLVTIMLGINDFQYGTIELGKLYNGSDFIDVPSTMEECTTFAKAEVYLIYNLIKRCPKATIAQILPLRRSGMNKNALGNTIDEFWDVIEKTCQHFSVPIIRLGAESSLLNKEVSGSGFFADAVHLNKVGHLVASYYIENHLALLVPTKQIVEVSTLSGNIIDGSGASVDISLTFTSASGEVITTAAGYNGAYSAELDNGVAYKITASGYSVSPSSITISEATTQDMTVIKY